MKQKEKDNREKLRKRKPRVIEKIDKYPNLPRLQYQLTYLCNFKCSFCSISKTKNKEKSPMTLDQIKTFFDEADKLGISRLTLTGGEPIMLGQKFEDIVKAIDPSRFWLQLDTNAYLLDRDKVYYAKNLGIDCIAPSLDSLDKKAHDDVRNCEGSADRVLKSFDYIQEAGLSTFVQTIVGKTRLYSDEFIEFVEYFNNRGIGVYVGLAKPVGEYEGNFNELIQKGDLHYLEELEKKYNLFSHLTPGYGRNLERKCVASKNICALSAYGDIFPCIFFFVSMGNVLEEPLKDIIDRCQRLRPFDKATCVMADKDDEFIEKYLVKKVYGKKLPVHHSEVFTKEDYE